jgi:hypothetical protein
LRQSLSWVLPDSSIGIYFDHPVGGGIHWGPIALDDATGFSFDCISPCFKSAMNRSTKQWTDNRLWYSFLWIAFRLACQIDQRVTNTLTWSSSFKSRATRGHRHHPCMAYARLSRHQPNPKYIWTWCSRSERVSKNRALRTAGTNYIVHHMSSLAFWMYPEGCSLNGWA